jgi:hypothetical protein
MTTMLVDLRAEAAAEVQRLVSARAVARKGDEDAIAQLEADGPWVTRARRPTLRRFLGRRLMLIWRVAYEDACGGRAESRLVPVVIELSAAPGTPRSPSWVNARLREVDADVRARIDADGREWQETVERVVRSFTSMRILRERGIAVWLAQTDRTAFQPGLFDRRAERAQRVHAAATAESDRITADRLATSERFAAVARRPAQLLLVLAP